MNAHSIIICTKNRSEPVGAAIESALANRDTAVIVVDQNLDDRVARAIDALAGGERVVHVRTDLPGAGRARNIGLAHVMTEYACFTDDDCVVPPDYASRMEAGLRQDPQAAVAFCRVAQQGDAELPGYAPVYDISEGRSIHELTAALRPEDLGIGAGMAVRVADVQAAGGFDPCMGPGGRFSSADDREMALRLLSVGRHVLDLAEPVVLHRGHRSAGREARALTKRDFVAMGAMLAKCAKAGLPFSRRSAVWFVGRQLRSALHDSRRLRRPAGLGKPVWTVVGFIRGMRMPIDRTAVVFLAPGRAVDDCSIAATGNQLEAAIA